MIVEKLRTLNARVYPKHVFQAPKWIVLGVNNVCNLHCKMCDVGTQNLESNFAQNLVGTRPLNMPLELVKQVIDDTATYFPTAKLAYAFTEPLVYTHLVESLEYANSKGVYTTITTNALTLEKKAEALTQAGLNELYVSLDGPPAIHNEIRGNKRSFEKALAGIQKIRELGSNIRIEVICAITQWNIGHLNEFLEVLRKAGVDEVAFMHTQFADPGMADKHNEKWGMIYPATASNLDEVDLSKMDLNLLLQEIHQIRKNDYPFRVSFSPEIDDMEGLNTFYHKSEVLLAKHCTAIFSSLMVKSDASVIPAHGRCFNLTVGNLNQNNLKEIWNSDTFSKFRTDIMGAGGLFEGCSRCCSAF